MSLLIQQLSSSDESQKLKQTACSPGFAPAPVPGSRAWLEIRGPGYKISPRGPFAPKVSSPPGRGSIVIIPSKETKELQAAPCCGPFSVSAAAQRIVLQSLSHIPLSATPWTPARQASLSFTISWSLLRLMSIETVMPSNHLILCHPLLLLPSTFPSIRVFSNESALHIRWSKYRSFSFSIIPSNEYSGLISFSID